MAAIWFWQGVISLTPYDIAGLVNLVVVILVLYFGIRLVNAIINWLNRH